MQLANENPDGQGLSVVTDFVKNNMNTWFKAITGGVRSALDKLQGNISEKMDGAKTKSSSVAKDPMYQMLDEIVGSMTRISQA